MNVRNIALLACAAAIAAIPSAGSASPVTRTFAFNAVFTDGGPVTTAGFTFGLTYDGGASDKPVDYFNTTSSDPAFNVKPVIFNFDGIQFAINGRESGLSGTLADFVFVFNTDLSSRLVIYKEAGGDNHFSSGLSTFAETTPATVPEPATWAMMVGGFGLVGGAVRRRRTQDSFA